MNKLLDELEKQIDSGKEFATLEINGTKYNINLKTIKDQYKQYCDSATTLVNAILDDNKLDLKKDIGKVSVSSQWFSNCYIDLIGQKLDIKDKIQLIRKENNMSTMIDIVT